MGKDKKKINKSAFKKDVKSENGFINSLKKLLEKKVGLKERGG